MLPFPCLLLPTPSLPGSFLGETHREKRLEREGDRERLKRPRERTRERDNIR